MRKGFCSCLAFLCLAGSAAAQAPAATDVGALPAPVPAAAAPAEPGCNSSPWAGCCWENSCQPTEHLWFRGEYLVWWLRGSPEPVPLITTFPVPTTSTTPGAIGQPDTSVLLGSQDMHSGARQGGRFTIGSWLDPEATVGVEASYLFIANSGESNSVASGNGATAPILVVPFVNVLTGKEAVGPLLGGPVNAPGFTNHTATLTTTNHLQGAELNGVFGLGSGNGYRLELIGGFRWLQFNEHLTFADSVQGLPGGPAAVFSYNALDQFDTQNNFYGGQLGVRGEYSWGKLFVNAAAKVALGDMHESFNINGSTQTNFFTGGAIKTLPGGIFAQAGNIGSYDRDRFCVVPEFDINLGYALSRQARVFVGYSFLYVNQIARAGNQIDRGINPTQTNFAAAAGIPPTGPARPSFSPNQTDFWAQGINFGFEFRY